MKPLSLDDDSLPESSHQRGKRIAVAVMGVLLLAMLVVLYVGITRAFRKEAADDTAGSAGASTSTSRITAPDGVWARGNARVSVDASVAGDDLLLTIYVDCTSNKGFTLRSWVKNVSVTDDAGNEVAILNERLSDAMVRQEWNSRPASKRMAYGFGRVTPETSRAEIIICARPDRSVKWVDVDLDARRVLENGTIAFRVPRQLWESGSR